MKSLLIFPLAALLNSFSMTAMLLVFGIVGFSETAANIALVQSATLALFYAFSANARNLILADPSGLVAIRLLQVRLILFIPLAAAAYILSVYLALVPAHLALVLIARRISEWIGEIGLARHERMNQPAFAVHAAALEGVAFLLTVLMPILFGWSLAVSAMPWALAPLLAVRGAKLTLRGEFGDFSVRSLLPHFGSTSIIGSCSYIFRLSITLLVGKSAAGELFTAFAIGGLIPTIFGQALAPSLTRRRGGGARLKKLLLAIPAAMLLIAAGITAAAITEPAWLFHLGRSMTFWLAVGLSIGGGALMTVAADLRTKLIQHKDGSEVFGPDLLANLLIATSVPFVFYVLGPRSLTGLYALSGFLSLFFMLGSGHRWRWVEDHQKLMLAGIAIMLMSPIFFQIHGGLFQSAEFVFESGGSIFRLPIPISVAGVFLGIALLGNYKSAARTMGTLFFTFLLFILAALVISQSHSAEQAAKMVLLAQYLLPMLALVLGEMYGYKTFAPFFERTALWFLLLIVPAQLLSTWLQGFLMLAPSLYVFSIYQHLQYFPLVIVSLTFVATCFFWRSGNWQYWAMLLVLPAIFVHAVASRSAIAVIGLLLGMLALIIVHFHLSRLKSHLVIAVLFGVAAATFYGVMSRSELTSKFAITKAGTVAVVTAKKAGTPVVEAPVGLAERIEHWRFYASGLIESPTAFLFGHACPPDRKVHPSAHNYWLDAAYNFGILALVPLFILLLWTLGSLWRWRSKVIASPLLLGVAIATVYLLLGENMLKVGMRQPYPGIITFFIWGLLIARLGALSNQKNSASTLP